MVIENSPRKAPYASVKPFGNALNRVRQLQLKKIDTSTLVKWGSTKYDASSILSAFKFLNLIDDQGNVTDNYTRLRADATYKVELSRITRSAYARLFELHADDFEGKNRKEIADTIILDDAYPDTAKRSADKAANLFIWLCSQSGIPAGAQAVLAKSTSQLPKTNRRTTGAAHETKKIPTTSNQHRNPVSELPSGVSLVITPSNTEEEIYEMMRRFNNALKRLNDENHTK